MSEADGIVDLYERHAREWDSDRGRDLFEEPWLARFLSLMDGGASILDVGCGSAEPIARYLIEQGCRVTGVDSSPTLIEMCRSRFPSEEWIVGDMRAMEVAREFSGILAWDSFFHLCPADQRLMFPVFRRHAKAGAALMFTSGPAYGEAIGSYRGEPLYHGSLDEDEYVSLLKENGFAVVSHVLSDATCGFHSVWLARAVG
jgi:SAM-dependent methyltransferase